MENQKGGFFSGLKKMIFKDEDVQAPAKEQQPVQPATQTVSEKEPAVKITPNKINVDNAGSPEAREDAAKKAYQLIESINQPGVDFFEVWNAVEENGGKTAAALKQAFNTLKYADKTLSKEKLLSSGNYYKNELQKALDSDIQKKNDEKRAIENKIAQSRQTLAADITALEEQLKNLQKTLGEKQSELSSLQKNWEPKLIDIDQKIQTGKHAIEGVIGKMQTLLELAEREL